MRKLLAIALFAAVCAGSQAQPLHRTVFYGGDPNGVNGLASERNNTYTATTYDDFNVPTGTIVGIYGRFLSDIAQPVSFDWEIRRGVSQGNSGMLLAAGTGVAGAWTKEPQYGFSGLDGYLAHIDGLNMAVNGGTYTLGLRVVTTGTGRAFLQTTSGASSVGSPIGNGNSFFDSAFFGANYDNAGNYVGNPADFSLGVEMVPEPASMLALAGALGSMAARRRRKK